MLQANKASLDRQTWVNWVQTVLIDEDGAGIGQSHIEMGRYAPALQGQYIWILDDDDECIRSTLFAELAGIILSHQPDVIMLRMDHGPRGILPDDEYWKQPPKHGHIGISAYVVRREIWQAHAAVWGPAYHSDYDFIRSIFDSNPKIYWHDVIASRVQQIGLGRPE